MSRTNYSMRRHCRPEELKRARREDRWPVFYNNPKDGATIPVDITITWQDLGEQ